MLNGYGRIVKYSKEDQLAHTDQLFAEDDQILELREGKIKAGSLHGYGRKIHTRKV